MSEDELHRAAKRARVDDGVPTTTSRALVNGLGEIVQRHGNSLNADLGDAKRATQQQTTTLFSLSDDLLANMLSNLNINDQSVAARISKLLHKNVKAARALTGGSLVLSPADMKTWWQRIPPACFPQVDKLAHLDLGEVRTVGVREFLGDVAPTLSSLFMTYGGDHSNDHIRLLSRFTQLERLEIKYAGDNVRGAATVYGTVVQSLSRRDPNTSTRLHELLLADYTAPWSKDLMSKALAIDAYLFSGLTSLSLGLEGVDWVMLMQGCPSLVKLSLSLDEVDDVDDKTLELLGTHWHGMQKFSVTKDQGSFTFSTTGLKHLKTWTSLTALCLLSGQEARGSSGTAAELAGCVTAWPRMELLILTRLKIALRSTLVAALNAHCPALRRCHVAGSRIRGTDPAERKANRPNRQQAREFFTSHRHLVEWPHNDFHADFALQDNDIDRIARECPEMQTIVREVPMNEAAITSILLHMRKLETLSVRSTEALGDACLLSLVSPTLRPPDGPWDWIPRARILTTLPLSSTTAIVMTDRGLDAIAQTCPLLEQLSILGPRFETKTKENLACDITPAKIEFLLTRCPRLQICDLQASELRNVNHWSAALDSLANTIATRTTDCMLNFRVSEWVGERKGANYKEWIRYTAGMDILPTMKISKFAHSRFR
jgi:hypothetical protein